MSGPNVKPLCAKERQSYFRLSIDANGKTDIQRANDFHQSGRESVTLLADVEDFLSNHRPHGPLTGDATEPAWNGYLLTVASRVGWCLRDGLRLRMLTQTLYDSSG
jgi:hypothetical protein